jgi:hypothetical protein
MRLSPHPVLAALALVLFCAACGAGGSPTPTALPVSALTATAAAATSDAQVETWAVATGTALKLTAQANLTPTLPPLTPGLGQPLATADLGICSPLATDCGPASPTAQPIATATPPPPAATRQPATLRPPPTAQPTPVPATASPSALDCYNKPCRRELIAPDGQSRWPETCIYLGMDTECYITFPNGQKTTPFRWPLAWSADGQFLLVPKYGSHDSPPGGYEIWNMAAGALSATVNDDNGSLVWSPAGHTLAYVRNLVYPAQEFRLLDAATGEQAATRQCPEWATRKIILTDKLDWPKLCDNWTPPADEPLILSFTVEPKVVNPGENVTLVWTTIYASAAQIESRPNARPASDPTAVPLSGSLVVTIGPEERIQHTFELAIRDNAGKSDRRSQSVDLRCADAFFFAASALPVGWACPYKPAAFVSAAEQAFQNGWMIWLAPISGANTASGSAQGPSIYVLYNTDLTSTWPQWQGFDDLWEAGQSEFDPAITPPAGLYQPQRGFGKVWRDQPEVRARLGWATVPEHGFAGVYQVKWDFSAGPGDFYLRAADGGILNLTLTGYWNRWQP